MEIGLETRIGLAQVVHPAREGDQIGHVLVKPCTLTEISRLGLDMPEVVDEYDAYAGRPGVLPFGDGLRAAGPAFVRPLRRSGRRNRVPKKIG
jgi:hypothetical protein